MSQTRTPRRLRPEIEGDHGELPTVGTYVGPPPTGPLKPVPDRPIQDARPSDEVKTVTAASLIDDMHFIALPEVVAAMRGLSPLAKLVYAFLIRCGRMADGEARPSILHVAESTGVSERQAQRAIAVLCAEGLVERQARYKERRAGKPMRAPNRYVFLNHPIIATAARRGGGETKRKKAGSVKGSRAKGDKSGTSPAPPEAGTEGEP